MVFTIHSRQLVILTKAEVIQHPGIALPGLRPSPACSRQAGMTTGCYSDLFVTVRQQPSNRLAQAKTQRPRRHSSESWNPVVFTIHSRPGGNDNQRRYSRQLVILTKAEVIQHPGIAFLDSSFRWNDDGVLFRLSGISTVLSFQPARCKQAKAGFRPSPACSRQAGMTTGCYSGLFVTVRQQPDNRLAQTKTQRPRRHSSESWNPVVFTIHSRLGGNDNQRRYYCQLVIPAKAEVIQHPGVAFLDSSFRLPAAGRLE